jgi:uncharacterized surface anchored protein
MMGRRRIGFTLLFVLAVALLAAAGGPVSAQGAGDIKGHVQDAEGKALAGVAVKLLQAGKKETQEQASDAEGNFHFTGLAGGVYIATAAMEGYGPVTCPGVRIVGVTRQLQVTLVPAGGGQSSSCRLGQAG